MIVKVTELNYNRIIYIDKNLRGFNMQHFQKSSKVIGSFIILAISQMIAEGIKTYVSNDSFNWIITLGLLFTAGAVLIFVEFMQNRRINTGKNTHSIAIRSSKFINDYYRKIKGYARLGKWEQKEEDIIKTINSITRHLLLIGEYTIRFKMGQLIYKHSKNDLYRMHALIDEIGWTAVLMGKRKSISYIKKAIDMAHFKITKPKDDYVVTVSEESYHVFHELFLCARAYRHIASTGFVELRERKDLSDKGLAICSYLISHLDKLPEEISKKKIESMKAGLDYGLGIIYLNYFKEKAIDDYHERNICLMNAYSYNKLAKDVVYNQDMHRYMKCLLIENEIYEAMNSHHQLVEEIKKYCINREDCKGMSDLDSKTYNENLSAVEKILNNSIYIDEAYEIFLQEKLKIKVKQSD